MASFSPIAQRVALHTESAVRAASEIRRAELTEIRALKAPPRGVFEVIRAVLSIMFHMPFDLDWIEAKKTVSEPKFLERMKVFDPSSMTPEDRATVTEVDHGEKPKISAVAKMKSWLEGMYNASLRVKIFISHHHNRFSFNSFSSSN